MNGPEFSKKPRADREKAVVSILAALFLLLFAAGVVVALVDTYGSFPRPLPEQFPDIFSTTRVKSVNSTSSFSNTQHLLPQSRTLIRRVVADGSGRHTSSSDPLDVHSLRPRTRRILSPGIRCFVPL